MKLRNNQWSFDSRDLVRSQCPHCTILSTARELQVPGLSKLLDSFYERPDNLPIRYGNKYEAELEQELLAELGNLVQKPGSYAQEDTVLLMTAKVPVIYQGSLRGGSGSMVFSGRPDFLLRSDYRFAFQNDRLTAIQQGGVISGYTAWDVKLSKTAKPDYQVQVGLYLDVLQEIDMCALGTHGLILGDRSIAEFDAEVLSAVMQAKREAYLDEVSLVLNNLPGSIADLGELICNATSYCQMCEYPNLCAHQRVELNHLQLVAGISKNQVESLRTVGVDTVRGLAGFIGSNGTLSEEKIAVLSRQARLQQHTYDTGEHVYEIKNQEPLDLLPQESLGDLFFDLEGFAFSKLEGGIEYLFGYMTIDGIEEFHYTWADSREAEKESFEKFVRFLLARLAKYPNLKVYHYANYELAALRRLAKRHKVMETDVEQLISGGVFIDLYNVVKASLVISQESYSIKKLENYYEFDRSADVKEAMGSMEYYDQYLSLVDSEPDQAEMLKRQVLNYNQDDCVSTLALCRWLRSL